MNISLTPELDLFINEKVQTGTYSSAIEVVREGLRLLKEQDQVAQEKHDQLVKDIDAGINDLDNGRYTELSPEGIPAFFDAIINESRNKLALRQQSKMFEDQDV